VRLLGKTGDGIRLGFDIIELCGEGRDLRQIVWASRRRAPVRLVRKAGPRYRVIRMHGVDGPAIPLYRYTDRQGDRARRLGASPCQSGFCAIDGFRFRKRSATILVNLRASLESEMGDKVAMISFRQWRITDDGLECRDDEYDIKKDRLAEKREYDKLILSDWLLQMAEKDWVDLEDFIAAWCAAVLVHRVKLGKIDVAKSIEMARKENQNP